MSITTTWSVNNTKRVVAEGGVILAYWSLVAASDAGGDETAADGGKNSFTYNASDSGFIKYDDLKESDVLGWIYDANKGPSTGGTANETANEYKARIEAERTAKVQAQIDRKSAQSDGLPWRA
tara:strand:- start:101 stop:469 length:369 start_codon:yes stop_codon:yes gene_type:complete